MSLKKGFIAVGVITLCLAVSIPFAQTNTNTGGNTNGGGGNLETYVYTIMNNTYSMLDLMNNLPVYLNNIATMALSWTAPEPEGSNITANLQTSFVTFSNNILNNMNSQVGLQPQLLSDLFAGTTPENVPYANDLAFTTLLNMPYYANDPRNKGNQQVNAAYNFIKNASGINIYHPAPMGGGNAGDFSRYLNYYSSIMAIESYNGFILSDAYAQYTNHTLFTDTQKNLINQASSSDWFSTVASESLGLVLRHLLMYQSESFVLQSQILETQKQMLTAQAMTNTLLILLNQKDEPNMAAKAAGQKMSVG